MNEPPAGPDPTSHPELADVRAAMRAEYRAERRATELEAVRDHYSRRSIADVLTEAMRRGDTVTIQISDHRQVTGTVVDAGRDFAIIQQGDQRTAVRVTDRDGHPYRGPELLVEIRECARTGGTQASQPSATFRSLLQRLDFESQTDSPRPIEVGVTFRPQPATGKIQTLAQDHLYLLDDHGKDLFVPLSAINYIGYLHSGYRDELAR